MAIYKPSNCTPFLTSWDITKTQYITCEINSSNQNITGYKIKILDSKNNVIFEGKKFTNLEQAVYNGSQLTVEFITNKQKPAEEANPNIIYYNNGQWLVAEGTEFNKEKFKNGYINQPYKWIITLKQGEGDNVDLKYYDMVISSGNVLGSTVSRLQGWLSEYIYSDYYVQLYNHNENNDELIGNRVRISSYDHSYGYLYPQEGGGITENNINQANRFKIYKDTNNPEYVSRARLINYLAEKNIDEVEYGGHYPKNNFSPVNISDKNTYFTQIYDGKINNSDITLDKYINNARLDIPLTNSITILFKNNGTGDYKASPYNGVFSFVSAEYDDEKKETTIRWIRPANFNTYSNYVDQVFCIESGSESGVNYECSANGLSIGTINITPLLFFEEEGIGLYDVYDENGNKDTKSQLVSITAGDEGWDQSRTKCNKIVRFSDGIISNCVLESVSSSPSVNILKQSCLLLGGSYYQIYLEVQNPIPEPNEDFSINVNVNINYMQNYSELFKNTPEKTYIKPFIGLNSDMKFFYGDNLENNLVIKEIDNTPNISNKNSPTWYIKHDDIGTPLISAGTSVKGTPYQIRSFFKTSDENPFYIYEMPVIKINKYNDSGEIEEIENRSKITDRQIKLKGEYEQTNNIAWKNFQFTLYDYNLNSYQNSGVIYRGEIEYTFNGLQNGHSYELTLTVENELNEIISKTVEFDVEVNTAVVSITEIKLDCNTQSIDINLQKISQINAESDIITVSKTNFKKSDNPENIENDQDNIEITGGIMGPQTDSFTISFKTIINSPNFEGDLARFIVKTSNTHRYLFRVELPQTVIEENGILVANDKRNLLFVKCIEQNRVNGQWEDGGNIYLEQSVELYEKNSNIGFGLQPDESEDYSKDPDESENVYDYLITDKYYPPTNKNLQGDYRYLFIEGKDADGNDAYLGYNGLIQNPLPNPETDDNNGPIYWFDENLRYDDNDHGNYYEVDKNGIPLEWRWDDNRWWHDDEDIKLKPLKPKYDLTGRQNLNNKRLHLLISLQNYNSDVNKTKKINVQVNCEEVEKINE